METQTRPLTLDEMYFKKIPTMLLQAHTIPGSINNTLMEPGGQLPAVEIKPNTPSLDLCDKVFVEPSFPEKAGIFIKKNWVWLLLGTGVIITCIVIHEKNKKKKQQNQLPIPSPY